MLTWLGVSDFIRFFFFVFSFFTKLSTVSVLYFFTFFPVPVSYFVKGKCSLSVSLFVTWDTLRARLDELPITAELFLTDFPLGGRLR